MISGLRDIQEIISPRQVVEAGVELNRLFGFPEVPKYDPFLLLDEMHIDTTSGSVQGLPAHPNRGVETVSYMLQGAMEYESIPGKRGTLPAGGCRWVNSAGGIIQREGPSVEAGEFWGVNLWINLPASDKYGESYSRVLMPGDIPVHRGDDGIITRIIAGEYEGIMGPGGRYPEACLFLDISIPPLTPLQIEIPREYRVLAWAAEGSGLYDLSRGRAIRESELIHYGVGERVALTTESDEVRLLLLAGRPLGEPVAWYGPIVMNSQDELNRAMMEYRDLDLEDTLF